MSTQLQTDELMVRSLRFNSSTGDNLIDVSAQFNHSEEWFPFNMDVLSPTTLQKAATAGNSISLNSGSYTNAQFYIASTNGNNVRTAFYANEQGGAIQAFDNNGMAPLNLQPQGGALMVGGSLYTGSVDIANYNDYWNVLTRNNDTGKTEYVPTQWIRLWVAGYSWQGGNHQIPGTSSYSWLSPAASGYKGIHTGGGIGTGATVLPYGVGYYGIQDYDHIIFCEGDAVTEIELPDPYYHDGREIKIIVSQDTQSQLGGGLNYSGSGVYVYFVGNNPHSYSLSQANFNVMDIFPAGQNDEYWWGMPVSPPDQFCAQYGVYPPSSILTIKSVFIPSRGQFLWIIVDQSFSA